MSLLVLSFMRERERELNPRHHNVFGFLIRIDAARGKVEQALNRQDDSLTPFWSEFNWLLIAYRYRRTEACEARLAEFASANANDGAFQIAEVFGFGREADAAFHWLEVAVQQRDPGLTDELLSTETLLGLHSDARWEPLVKKMGLLEAYRNMPGRDSWPDIS